MRKLISIIMTSILGVLMIAPVFAFDEFVSISGLALGDKSGYVYPITVDSPEWDEFTVAEKVEMLKIPENVLRGMTDHELIQAIADYPYLVDIYLYGDSVEEGMSVARTYFSALDELLSRETAEDALLNYGVDLASSNYRVYQKGRADENIHEAFVAEAMLDILDATSEDVDVFVTENVATYVSSRYVYTPDDAPVLVYVLDENHTTATHDAADAEVVNAYNVTLISRGSCQYNCHSYAWYSQLTYNQYWMNDPTPYMEGPSYVRKYIGGIGTQANSTSIRYGDIIFYGDPDGDMSTWHSAIYYSTTNSGAPLSSQLCRSKWGQLGVFAHGMGNVPAAYDRTSISAWRWE